MFKSALVSLSVLAASLGGHARLPHSTAAPPGAFAAEYASHAAAERADAVPPPPPAPPSVPDIIRGAFAGQGPATVNWAEQIAWCESKYDPGAVNAGSGAEGLFQFLPTTWAGTPFAASSPFDPVANARAAAWLLQTYGPSQWECRA